MYACDLWYISEAENGQDEMHLLILGNSAV